MEDESVYLLADRNIVRGSDSAIDALQTPVNPLKDIIFLDGRSIPKKAPPKYYFALNKPKG